MRILYSLPVLAMVAACGSGNASESSAAPSGVEGSRSFAATGFDKVALRGADNVVVKVGPAESVTARGDTAVLDRLKIEVVDGTLRIERRERDGVLSWRKGDKPVLVTVTLPRLVGAVVAGSGDMDVDRAHATSFAASVAGSGNLRIVDLTADATALNIAGSGDATIGGRGQSIDISLAGSGDADMGGYKAAHARISLAGSGDVKAGVDGTADVSLIGSGDVEIVGKAACTVSKLGSGAVRCGG